MKVYPIVIILTFISFSIQTLISKSRKLTNYDSNTVHQEMTTDNSFLVFAGLKAFKYTFSDALGDVDTDPLPAYTLVDNSYMNDEKSSVLIKTKAGLYLMACGTESLTMFNEQGTILANKLTLPSYSNNQKCSLSELDSNYFLLVFTCSNELTYQITHILYHSDNNTFEVLLKRIIPGNSSPIICKAFPTEPINFIICIYFEASQSLQGLLYTKSNTIKQENILLSSESNIHYSLLEIDERTIYAFSMVETNGTLNSPIVQIIQMQTSTETVLIISKHPIIDSSKSVIYSCPLTVVRISYNVFIACLCNSNFFFIQKYYNDLKTNGALITIDTTYSAIQVSIGVFNQHSVAFLLNDISRTNYLFSIEFPICKSSHIISPYSQNPKIDLKYMLLEETEGIESTIVFTSRDPEIFAGESQPEIEIGAVYSADDYFTMLSTGHFQYVYNLIQDINGIALYSLDCTITVDICNDLCDSCTKYGDENDHQCLTCISGYHLIETRPYQCVDNPDDNNFYLDSTDNTYKVCHNSCAECSGPGNDVNSNCDICADIYYPHPILPKYCLNTLIEGYYIDTVNKVYIKCFETCKFCKGKSENECTDCKNGFIEEPLASGICLNRCQVEQSTYLYYDENGDYHCTKSQMCINEKAFLILKTFECVETCPIDIQCQIKKPTCGGCSSNSLVNYFDCNCITEEDIKKIIENASKGIIDISKGEVIANYNSTSIELIRSSSLSQNLYNSSYISPNEIDKLKQQINIPASEDIIIFKQDIITINSTKLVNDVKLSLFYNNQTQINMTFFFIIRIIITVPIQNTSDPKYELGVKLADLGIDITNQNDPFFTNICYQYETDNKTDPTRKDKYRYYLMDNSTLCPDGCVFESINFKLNKSNCSCSVNNQTDIDQTPFEVLKDSLIHALLDANWEVVTCYMFVFNNSMIPTNIGHWVVVILFIVSIVNITLFLYSSFKPLEDYLRTLYSNQPAQVVNQEKKRHSFQYDTKNQLGLPAINSIFVNKKKLTSLQGLGIEYSIQDLNESNQIVVYNKKNALDIKPQENLTTNKNSYSYEDYRDMTLDILIIEDKRTFIQRFCNEFMVSQPILGTFCYNSNRSIKTIKVALLVLGAVIDLSISAIFYFDTYISQHYTGQYSFFYNFPISLYTYLFRSVFNTLFSYLTSTKDISKILKVADKEKRKEMSEGFLKNYRVRIVIFFILKAILLVFFWYYTSAFCGTYKNNQIEWMISGLTSFAISQLIPCAFSLLTAILIQMSIRTKSKCLYKLYHFL